MKKILFIILCIILSVVVVYAEPEIPEPQHEGYTAKSITWNDATTSVAANLSPTTDTAVNVFRASTINVSCSTLTADDIGITGNGSTDVDVDVLASADCTNYDVVTAPYMSDVIASMNDNQQNTAAITTGPRCIKLRADNDAGTTLDLTCRILATWN